MKLSEKTLQDIGVDNDFLYRTQEDQATKLDKWDYIQEASVL
jgi:hypothetical protein